MDGSVASIGSGKGKLAVIKDSSSEQLFDFTFISLWISSWRQYLAFSDRFITCITYLDEAAKCQGHVLLLLCGRTGIAVLRLKVSFSSKCKGSTFSFLSVEIIVLRTERLVCLPVNPAASLMDFINEPSEFLPRGCFLNQILDDGLAMDAK